MTWQPVCVRSDDGLDVLVDLIKTHKFHGFPVLDAAGRLVGIVRDTDVISIFARRDPASRAYARVEDIMHTPPLTIGLKESIQNAVMKMFADQTRFLVVVDEERKPVGIVTRIDLVKGIRCAKGGDGR